MLLLVLHSQTWPGGWLDLWATVPSAICTLALLLNHLSFPVKLLTVSQGTGMSIVVKVMTEGSVWCRCALLVTTVPLDIAGLACTILLGVGTTLPGPIILLSISTLVKLWPNRTQRGGGSDLCNSCTVNRGYHHNHNMESIYWSFDITHTDSSK